MGKDKKVIIIKAEGLGGGDGGGEDPDGSSGRINDPVGSGGSLEDLLLASSEELDAFNRSIIDSSIDTDKLAAETNEAEDALNALGEEAEDLEETLASTGANAGQLTRNLSALMRSAGLLTTRQNQMLSTSLTLGRNLSRLATGALGVTGAMAGIVTGSIVVAVAFGAMALAAAAFVKGVDALLNSVKRFSAEAAIVSAEGEIQALEDEALLAEQSGGGIAELGEISNEIKAELRQTTRNLIATFMPVMKWIGETINAVFKVMNVTLIPLIRLILLPINKALEVLFWFQEKLEPFIEPVFNLIERILVFFNLMEDEKNRKNSLRGNAMLRELFDPDNIGFDTDAHGDSVFDQREEALNEANL